MIRVRRSVRPALVESVAVGATLPGLAAELVEAPSAAADEDAKPGCPGPIRALFVMSASEPPSSFRGESVCSPADVTMK